MRFQIRTRLFERLHHTCFETIGVKPIEEEQAPNEIIAPKRFDDGWSGGRRLG